MSAFDPKRTLMDPVLQLDRSVLAVPAYEGISGAVDAEVGGHLAYWIGL